MDSQNLPEESQSLAPLNLNPPLLPGWKTPVVGYDGGLGVSAVLGGLNFVIDPWLNMDADDEVKVYAGNATGPVWSKTIKPDEKDQRVRGTIEPGYILRGDLYPLFYTVKRISQQAPEESTPRQRLLVKLDRPGGFDDDYAEEGHSHLRYSIPQTIIDNGVGPGEAKAGVPITIPAYPFMRRHDQVIYVWGHVRKSIKVSPDQAEKPDDHPLIVTIDKDTIELVGDGNKIPFYYQVVDEVGNYPDERSPWSATTYLTVDLKQQRHDAPIIIEADPVSDVIDLADLGENDVTVLVNTGDFNANDIIALTWTGTPAEGPQVIHGPIELPVVRVGIAVTFDIPNAKVKAIAKGRALVSYVRNPATDKEQSLNASVKVEGDISRLLAPNILEAAGGHLPVDSKPVTVSVPYYVGRNTGDLISVHCEGKRADGGSTYYPIRIIVSDEPEGVAIERSVPASEISPLDGGTLKVYYTVANDDVVLNSVRESLPLDLSVGQAQADLPKPDVTQADDNDVLLPENAPTGADITAPFTETLDKDIIGLRWIGSISGAHPTYEIPLNTHTAGHPVPFNVKPSYITANRNGTVDVSYYLRRAQVPTRGSLVRTLSIGVTKPKWNAPKVLQAPDGQLDPNVHQNGFTVQVDTIGMADGDGIDLIVDGRPGEGSIRLERRYISGQAPIDFTIAALITGANIGREVGIVYEVVKGTGPQPSERLPLQVGELLERNLPTPFLEGFEGDVLNLNNIKDNTRLRLSKWPFQLNGAPAWLSYTEFRRDGTTRKKDQLTGQPLNQSDGLTLTAEVLWLRECIEDSTVSMEVNAGLFRAALLDDALTFPVRTYEVQEKLDDLTEFTGGDWNGWRAVSGYNARVSQEAGNSFAEGLPTIGLEKTFSLKVDEQYEISFDYYINIPTYYAIFASHDYTSGMFSGTNIWANFSFKFTARNPFQLVSIILKHGQTHRIDNIRFRQKS